MNQLTSLLPNLPFLALLIPLIAMWGQIKEFASKIVRLLIIEVKIDGFASKSVTYFLSAKAKSLPTNILRYSSVHEYLIKKKRTGMIIMQILAGLKGQLFWYKGTLIGLSDLRGKDKESETTTEMGCSLRYLRGTFDHESMMLEAAEWTEEKENRADGVPRTFQQFRITRFIGKNGTTQTEQAYSQKASFDNGGAGAPMSSNQYESYLHNRLLGCSLTDIGYAKKEFFYAFNESTRRIRDDVARWLKSQEWHEEKGILHRRGALLYGAPGSGKTAAIRRIAQELDIPLYLFELNTMNDVEFIEFWDRMSGGQRAIVVFEDIDCTFNKRENIAKGGRLSFECVLNCISGVKPAEGVYLFVTTNRLDYLDEALGIPNAKGQSTRPGRLDTCFEVGNITDEQKHEIVNHFLSEHPEIGAKLIEESNGCTAAQFSDLCSQKALELYWENKM